MNFLPGFEHEARLPDLSQWHTEPRLAKRVWDWANRYEYARTVLEPACGHGALVKPILEQPYDCTNVTLVDIDPRCTRAVGDLIECARRAGMFWECECLNFLERRQSEYVGDYYDLVLMNPPYEDGRAEEFILHALAISGRVVGIFKASIHHGLGRFRMLWAVARATREVKLATRPTFGRGESGSKQGETDFVVLEIKRLAANEDMSAERWSLQEHWA
jgi:predicted RNA methylase